MKIRKVKKEDKKEILRLVGFLYGKSSPKTVNEWQKNYRRKSHLTFITESRKKVVAYIAMNKEANAIYIEDLYVLPKYRKKGIARKLIWTAEKVRKNLKKMYLIVDVRKKDKPAVALYSKLGFKFWKPKSKTSMKLRK